MIHSMYSLLLATCLTTGHAEEATLFERLGGEPVLTRAIDQMVATMTRDPEIAATLEGIDHTRFSRKLYLHLCATTGGPCTYAGDDLHTIHAGMNITKRQLDVSADALVAALDANGVDGSATAELIRLRAPMKQEILR